MVCSEIATQYSEKYFSSFMTEFPIIQKPVYWAGFYMIGTSVMKDLIKLTYNISHGLFGNTFRWRLLPCRNQSIDFLCKLFD